ncbi:hypothetical protein BVC93_07425 [Mycobacterium sp. MS1601]|uniref:hypothetical protein n=1 Tax=Mycobacterium sp. MS1601 TaxID=1936029 RepID=UPI0009797F7E|nr:hypothetical protein [Mycobacterium sp. MS1601]AQA02290.1 hypothetical protein BVC93_07425 [Mycobacterium sp. MS1601]
MRATILVRPVLSAAAASCLVLCGVELPAADPPAAHRSSVVLTASTAPLVAPPALPVVYREVVLAHSGDRQQAQPVVTEAVESDPASTGLTPIDYLDAIGAAAYLAVAGPLLLVSIPFQVITGQSEDVVVSLNNLIQAVNTILKLVGRSIAPIPVPSAQHPVEDKAEATTPEEQIEDVPVDDVPATELPDADSDPAVSSVDSAAPSEAEPDRHDTRDDQSAEEAPVDEEPAVEEESADEEPTVEEESTDEQEPADEEVPTAVDNGTGNAGPEADESTVAE